MSIKDIIRAWEDPAYRKILSNEERAMLPANPVGEIELTEAELTEVWGAGAKGSNGGGNGCNKNNNHSCNCSCDCSCDCCTCHCCD